MTHPGTVPALGQTRLAEQHRQAQHAVLARAPPARRARRQQPGHPGRGVLTVVTALARHPKPAPESS